MNHDDACSSWADAWFNDARKYKCWHTIVMFGDVSQTGMVCNCAKINIILEYMYTAV